MEFGRPRLAQEFLQPDLQLIEVAKSPNLYLWVLRNLLHLKFPKAMRIQPSRKFQEFRTHEGWLRFTATKFSLQTATVGSRNSKPYFDVLALFSHAIIFLRQQFALLLIVATSALELQPIFAALEALCAVAASISSFPKFYMLVFRLHFGLIAPPSLGYYPLIDLGCLAIFAHTRHKTSRTP